MTKVIVFKPGHLDFIEPGPWYPEYEGFKERVAAMDGPGAFMYTIIKNEIPIAVVGGTIVWPRVMEIFAVTSKWVKEYPMAFAINVRKLLMATWAELDLQRMQMTVIDTFPDGKRFAESMGFQHEGKLRGLGPNQEDYSIYGRIKGWHK